MSSPLSVTTPLGPGALLATGLNATEPISGLFLCHLDLVTEHDSIPFEGVVGQPVTVRLELPGGKARFFNGICSRFSEGRRGGTFTSYRAEVVPWLWFLTKKRNSRIFQQKSATDIVRLLFAGPNQPFSVRLEGSYPKREFCVQYRESDFNFASRLMEEEGIYYYFRHTDTGHTMVLGDTPAGYSTVPGPGVVVFGRPPSTPDTKTVFAWSTEQELRSGKVTLFDHNFELPHKHLQGDATIQPSVQVGTVTHQMLLPANRGFELFDYPGEYAKRFDQIGPGGEVRPGDIEPTIQADADRTAGIRMQEEAARGVFAEGLSNCRHFVAGHMFTLDHHFNRNGKYLLTSVHHRATISGDPRTATEEDLEYDNSFTCIPIALPFRPARATPLPSIRGPQTAYVVGPAGSETFTDKYGRVKVQFHWDRGGKNDENSSCWIRVAALHAGLESGFLVIPRIGQEVVVDFLEGDPDQPVIVGSVYNPDHLPPSRNGAG
ncbi:MAG TPA: type VI secretion system tip protein TssI/VgrG [Actinomycetota bacterium]